MAAQTLPLRPGYLYKNVKIKCSELNFLRNVKRCSILDKLKNILVKK